MKISTIKKLFVTTLFCIMGLQSYAQDFVGIRIDVIGSRYSDKMWLFTQAECTTNFDNGWDGYKMIGTNTYAPQIYAVETGGNFQVDAISNFDGTTIAFRPGEDKQYTFSFYSENLASVYQKLYLVDLVTNKTIDIRNSGTLYTFSVDKTIDPLLRFKIVTSLPEVPVVVETPPVVEPTDTVVAVVPPVAVTPVDPIMTPDPVVVNNDKENKGKKGNIDLKDKKDNKIYKDNRDNKGNKDSKDDKDKKDKKLKITCAKRTIIIDNQGKGKGSLKIYNAITGRLGQTAQINSNDLTIIESNVPTGTYVINGVTSDDDVSVTVIIK